MTELPSRPKQCGHCGSKVLFFVNDVDGRYWHCLCGWTTDTDNVPDFVFLEGLGLADRKRRHAGRRVRRRGPRVGKVRL